MSVMSTRCFDGWYLTFLRATATTIPRTMPFGWTLTAHGTQLPPTTSHSLTDLRENTALRSRARVGIPGEITLPMLPGPPAFPDLNRMQYSRRFNPQSENGRSLPRPLRCPT